MESQTTCRCNCNENPPPRIVFGSCSAHWLPVEKAAAHRPCGRESAATISARCDAVNRKMDTLTRGGVVAIWQIGWPGVAGRCRSCLPSRRLNIPLLPNAPLSSRASPASHRDIRAQTRDPYSEAAVRGTPVVPSRLDHISLWLWVPGLRLIVVSRPKLAQ